MDVISKKRIEFENYVTTIFQISNDLQFMERTHHFLREKNDFDVFPTSWFLIFPQYASNSVQVKTVFGNVDIKNQTAIFLPPLKIIRWKLLPGDIKWYAYRGESVLPQELQKEAFMFNFSQIPMFKYANDIFDFVAKGKPTTQLPSELTASMLARKVKNLLDCDFDKMETSKLAQIAETLGKKPNEISQAFKRCYGVNPLDYKNRLKLNKALHQIWLDKENNITNIGYESGFEEYSAFYRNFLKWMGVEPSYIARQSKEISTISIENITLEPVADQTNLIR